MVEIIQPACNFPAAEEATGCTAGARSDGVQPSSKFREILQAQECKQREFGAVDSQKGCSSKPPLKITASPPQDADPVLAANEKPSAGRSENYHTKPEKPEPEAAAEAGGQNATGSWAFPPSDGLAGNPAGELQTPVEDWETGMSAGVGDTGKQELAGDEEKALPQEMQNLMPSYVPSAMQDITPPRSDNSTSLESKAGEGTVELSNGTAQGESSKAEDFAGVSQAAGDLRFSKAPVQSKPAAGFQTVVQTGGQPPAEETGRENTSQVIQTATARRGAEFQTPAQTGGQPPAEETGRGNTGQVIQTATERPVNDWVSSEKVFQPVMPGQEPAVEKSKAEQSGVQSMPSPAGEEQSAAGQTILGQEEPRSAPESARFEIPVAERMVPASSSAKAENASVLPEQQRRTVSPEGTFSPVANLAAQATPPTAGEFQTSGVEPATGSPRSASDGVVAFDQEMSSTGKGQPFQLFVGGGEALAGTENPVLARITRPSVEILQQVVQALEGSIQSGRSSMRIQLHPQNLGSIDIHLVNDSQGISVTVIAEQASTGRLLETQIDQLRQSLLDSGIQLSNLNINQDGSASQQGRFLQQQPEPARFFNRENRNMHGRDEMQNEVAKAPVRENYSRINYLV